MCYICIYIFKYTCRLPVYLAPCLGCSSAEEGNLQFPILHSCQATTHPCVKYHPMFKGGEVVRKCSIAGETLTLDFSNCTVSNGDFSTPFAVVSFTFSGTSGSTYTAALPRIRTDVRMVGCTLLYRGSVYVWLAKGVSSCLGKARMGWPKESCFCLPKLISLCYSVRHLPQLSSNE